MAMQLSGGDKVYCVYIRGVDGNIVTDPSGLSWGMSNSPSTEPSRWYGEIVNSCQWSGSDDNSLVYDDDYNGFPLYVVPDGCHNDITEGSTYLWINLNGVKGSVSVSGMMGPSVGDETAYLDYIRLVSTSVVIEPGDEPVVEKKYRIWVHSSAGSRDRITNEDILVGNNLQSGKKTKGYSLNDANWAYVEFDSWEDLIDSILSRSITLDGILEQNG